MTSGKLSQLDPIGLDCTFDERGPISVEGDFSDIVFEATYDCIFWRQNSSIELLGGNFKVSNYVNLTFYYYEDENILNLGIGSTTPVPSNTRDLNLAST